MSDSSKQEETLSADTDPLTSWGIVVFAFFVGGTASAVAISSSNFLSFLFFGCLVASPFWFIFTESGAQYYMDNIENSNQSTQTSHTSASSQTNVICQSCGWQNSQDNNFCHDCGAELGDVSGETKTESTDNPQDD